jgi:hypothetical protein
LLFGLLGAAVSTIIGLLFVSAGGHPLLLSGATIVRYIAGAAIGSALLSSAGVALGSLIRSQVGAIITLFVWGFIIEQTIGGVFSSAQRFLPFSAAASMAGSEQGNITSSLPFVGAVALVAAVAVAMSAIAARTTLSADIT